MKRFRDTKYIINEDGRVFSEKSNMYLKPVLVNSYHRITINGRFFSIHRLVAEVYCEGFNINLQVNHKDGNKLNNHYTNLEWCTPSENKIHAHKNNLIKSCCGKDHPCVRLTEKEVIEIRSKYVRGKMTYSKLAEIYNVDRITIFDVIKRKTWKHI